MERQENTYAARIAARHRTYEGFGEKHTAAEWAACLDIPRNSLWRYLANGLTIEQVVWMRGIEYHPENALEK